MGSRRKQRPNLCGETDEQRLPEAWGRPLHTSALGAKASLATVPSGIGLPPPSQGHTLQHHSNAAPPPETLMFPEEFEKSQTSFS